MDISHTLQDINFIWDEHKATANEHKHGISFVLACESFFDPFMRVVDTGVVEGEMREAVIGMTVSWQLLSVVYVLLEADNVVRIISARPAVKHERDLYEHQ